LIENDNGGLEIHQSFNQESPKMDFMIERNGEARPILNLDVWEHAYYLDYKNVRVDFIKNIWQLVN
jgi:Fe-Mn family superoxide dismutase